MTNVVNPALLTSLKYQGVRKYQALARERFAARNSETPDNELADQLTVRMRRLNRFIKSR